MLWASSLGHILWLTLLPRWCKIRLTQGTSTFRAGHEGALFFCIHGAGHSALSFATLAKEVKNFGTLVAFDFKGHGYSKRTDNLTDFSI